MKLLNLRPLYRSIKSENKTYATFQFRINGVDFDVFFDTASTPFRLGFILIDSNFDMWFDVRAGFDITPNVDNATYKKLVKILGLKYDPENKFSPTRFFEEFNKKIPLKAGEYSFQLASYVAVKTYKVEEGEKLRYHTHIKWFCGRKRSNENSLKTRLLYPDIFEAIKNDPTISIAYIK